MNYRNRIIRLVEVMFTFKEGCGGETSKKTIIKRLVFHHHYAIRINHNFLMLEKQTLD